MTQRELNRAVAEITGEAVGTIAGMGFSLADPVDVSHDPEPIDGIDDLEGKFLDWDAIDAERNVPLVLQPAA